MERTYARLAPFVGVISLTVLAACGTSTSSGGSASSGGGSDLSACSGDITVASDLPTSGADATDGLPTQNGAQLAVDQANASKLLGGCKIKYLPMNDSSVALGKHDPQLGAQNISALASNDAVLGVIGPFNSSVAKSELAVSNKANLVQISPSNTNPGLTITGGDPTIDTASLRPTGQTTYFRVCTTDVGQGQVLGKAAKDTLHATKVYIFDDQETYGQGLADQFTKVAQTASLPIVKRVSLPGDTKDFKGPLTEAKGLGADLIFYAGTTSNGGAIIRKQMTDVGLTTAKFLGGDGISDSEFIKVAGQASDGVYYSVVAPDPLKLDSAKTFSADYKKAFSEDPGAYSANGFDGMNILLQAIKKVLTDNGGKKPADPAAFRESVRKAMLATDYTGAIGHTTFNSVGDTSNGVITIELIQGGKAASVQTIVTKVGG